MSEKVLEVAECKYCGQVHQVEVEGGTQHSDISELATKQCDCVQAVAERKGKTRKENIESDINALFEEFEDAKLLLLEAVVPIMKNSIETITIDTGKKVKGKMTMTSKGNIKVERIATQKVASES